MTLHNECGKVVHRPCSSCISSIQNLMETPSSFPCQLGLGVWLSHLRLSHYTTQSWDKFTAQELWDTLKKCTNNSTPGPNYVSWRYLKGIITHSECMANIADACFDLGFWSSHFKQSTSIIIPKPNKTCYDTPKSFHPIVLLNTLGKLIEKAISHHIQFQAVQSAFLHPNQLSRIIQRSTTDAGSFLTYTIQAGWTKQLKKVSLHLTLPSFSHS